MVLAVVVALVVGVGLFRAQRAEAKPYTYCTAWQWATNPRFCAWWVACGPTFWINVRGQWIRLDYCGNQIA